MTNEYTDQELIGMIASAEALLKSAQDALDRAEVARDIANDTVRFYKAKLSQNAVNAMQQSGQLDWGVLLQNHAGFPILNKLKQALAELFPNNEVLIDEGRYSPTQRTLCISLNRHTNLSSLPVLVGKLQPIIDAINADVDVPCVNNTDGSVSDLVRGKVISIDHMLHTTDSKWFLFGVNGEWQLLQDQYTETYVKAVFDSFENAMHYILIKQDW